MYKSSRLESVTDPVLRVQVPGFEGIDFQLVAQLSHIHTQILSFISIFISPDML